MNRTTSRQKGAAKLKRWWLEGNPQISTRCAKGSIGRFGKRAAKKVAKAMSYACGHYLHTGWLTGPTGFALEIFCLGLNLLTSSSACMLSFRTTSPCKSNIPSMASLLYLTLQPCCLSQRTPFLPPLLIGQIFGNRSFRRCPPPKRRSRLSDFGEETRLDLFC